MTPQPHRVVVATDLDRTLIYSRAAMGAEQFATLAPHCVEIYQDQPISYMTASSIRLLQTLSHQTSVVPVTTRTPEQYRRIELPGAPYDFAIVSNGGRILVGGADDHGWRRTVEARVLAEAAALAEVTAELERRIDETWVRKVRIADDLFCYLVVDTERQPAGFLDDWTSWCADRGWVVSQQGRKIYATPAPVRKSTAMAEVRRRLVEARTATSDAALCAAGDGWLDADLLLAADLAIRPRHGELERMGWRPDGVQVTTATGALAGEEILGWFAKQVATDADTRAAPAPLSDLAGWKQAPQRAAP